MTVSSHISQVAWVTSGMLGCFFFNCYFCYSREKIPDNQPWAGTCNEKGLEFFHVFSEDFLIECALVLKFIFKVWWSSFHSGHFHESDIKPSQIFEIESLKNGCEFPQLETLPAIVIHTFPSTGTTLPSWVWFLQGNTVISYISSAQFNCSFISSFIFMTCFIYISATLCSWHPLL